MLDFAEDTRDARIEEEHLFAEPFAGVARARGYFDRITCQADGLHVEGWMMLPDTPFTAIAVYLDGQRCGWAKMEHNAGVAEAFAWSPYAGRTGFRIVFPQIRTGSNHLGRIDLLAYLGGQPVAQMGGWFRTDLDTRVPTPPPQLMQRVAATDNSHAFKINGFKNYGEFVTALRRHRNPDSIGRMLDWGCGCGRLTTYFLNWPNLEVHGCDIDAEAIDWCSNHLSGAAFTRAQAWPKLPYDDESFDLIIGFSVLTHLAPPAQEAWLEEMRRVLAPGGVLLASVHGPFALRFEHPATYAELLRDGVYVAQDARLEGIAPDDYYCGTFQTIEYTSQKWARYLDVVEYIERGASNAQDLVVLRRPDAVAMPAKSNGQMSPTPPARGSASPTEKKAQPLTEISPQDNMYVNAPGGADHYFAVGRAALRAIRLAMMMAGKEKVSRILDLPCGYGRVMRHLAAAFPDAPLAACELIHPAVDFCVSRFGAEAVYGAIRPQDTPLKGHFDLIWSGSLLTHLSFDRWRGFLDLFTKHLAPGGLLVFTVGGSYVAQRMRGGFNYGLEDSVIPQMLDRFAREGFAYHDYRDGDGYGISIASQSRVCGLLEQYPLLRMVSYTQRGWDDHQDVVACVAESANS